MRYKRCLAAEAEAWAEMWLKFDHWAAQAVRRLVERAGFDPVDADDATQEIFLTLYANQRRLWSFRGESENELHVWLVRVAVNFTRDWIEKRWRSRKRERRTIKAIATQGRQAATDADVETILKELEAVLSHEDANQLRIIAGIEVEPETAHSSRTERRRRAELERKVREQLGLPARRKLRQAKGKGKKS